MLDVDKNARPLSADTLSPGQNPQPVQGRQDRLLHGYLHKTSNSLCGIKGYASLIASERGPDQRTLRWARKIIAEVEQMEMIYHSVQEMAFPQRCRLADGDLATVVAQAVAAPLARHAEISVKVAQDLIGEMLLPARDLALALKELLNNSVESALAVPRKRKLGITIRTVAGRDDRVALQVEDDGPGLDPDLVPQAATPFVTTKPGHLGIGLARVDTIMDMYGLAWSLHSEKGSGTCVVMEVARRCRAASSSHRASRKGE